MPLAANWPSCPLCQRWGCWWLWSSGDPKFPSSRSCRLFACKQSQPRQIRRCACCGGKHGVMGARVWVLSFSAFPDPHFKQTLQTKQLWLIGSISNWFTISINDNKNKCLKIQSGFCLLDTFTGQLTPPVLLPLVHAGDHAHFAVAFRSAIGDQRLILEKKRGREMIPKANKARDQLFSPHRVWPFLWPMYL